MRVLIACEESQEVCKAFRELGHEAFSCDTLECSGGHPEWHIQDNVLNHLEDGWDLMIAHPPCTHLSVSGARWFASGHKPKKLREDALAFVQKLMNAPIDKICIENPISIISSKIRKPEQIIRPYQFGENSTKATCLWLKNLPKLEPTKLIEPEKHTSKSGKVYDKWWFDTCLISDLKLRAKIRSKTFPRIAQAMAKQWGTVGGFTKSLRDFPTESLIRTIRKLLRKFPKFLKELLIILMLSEILFRAKNGKTKIQDC